MNEIIAPLYKELPGNQEQNSIFNGIQENFQKKRVYIKSRTIQRFKLF